MNKRNTLRLLLVICLGAFAWLSLASDGPIPSSLAGGWKGDATIIVTWCHQKTLPVAVTIAADGRVTGKVGDATLSNAHLERNRGWLGRRLHLATDYIITGDLTGPVVAAEGITRTSVKIPLDASGGALVGGLHTSGSKFGGKSAGILSASSLTLKP